MNGAFLKFLPISELARSSSIDDVLAPISAIAPSNHTIALTPNEIMAAAIANCISLPKLEASRMRNRVPIVAAVYTSTIILRSLARLLTQACKSLGFIILLLK